MLVYPYKQGSKSVKNLALLLGIKRIRTNSQTFRGAKRKLVINWGSSVLPAEVLKCKVLNPPASVQGVSNKLKFFRGFSQKARLPEYTTDKGVAKSWADNGAPVVCRTKLQAHSGIGIVIADKAEEVVDAPLYTKYVKKRDEFRLHIFGGVVIDVQRKARKLENEAPDWRVRNLANGFVYQRNDVEVPEDVVVQATGLFKETGLDFGAVDVIYNAKEGKAYVLEVNSAPGLEGTTLANYVGKLKEWRD